MTKVLIGNVTIDREVFDKIETERKDTPRATYINQKLRELHNL